MRSAFIGKVIDNYRILESLGIGGMGVVFKAINIKIDKLVALKMIAPGMAMNQKFIRRFQAEAKALAKLADPNIVSIYDLRSDNDQWFIVMEYVNGKNISDLIRKNGAFSIPQAVNILKQILNAVGHAHKSGIVHRDLKPNNIMLTKDNMVKITDFGLAKIQSDIINTMTVAGGGTLYYMPPEQVKDFSQTDIRSDIYSIGMTFFEMVTGKVPFENIDSDFDIRETIVHKELNKPSVYKADIPLELENIIIKAIAKNPDERYQSADEMLNDLLKFENSIAGGAEKDSSTNSEAENKQTIKEDESYISFGREKKSPIPKILAAAVLLIILIGIIFLFKDGFSTKKSAGDLKAQMSVTSSPPQAELLLNGKHIGNSPISSFSLKPKQKYYLSVLKDGYQPVDTVFTPQGNDKINFSFSLSPFTAEKKKEIPLPAAAKTEKNLSPIKNSAQISLTSTPPGAEVEINGESKGITPIQIKDIPNGEYIINVKKEGYEPFSEKLELKGAGKKQITVTLKQLTGNLSINTKPSGAVIRIDDKLIGKLTPAAVDNISAGKHTIKILKEGYAPYSTAINIAPQKTESLDINLKQAFGTLSVLVKPWGSVYIDDQLKKESASFVNQFKLPAGKHLLKITHPSLGYWQDEVVIEHENTKKIEIDFNRKYKINISAEDKNGRPVSANIFIDGKDSGEITPKQIELNSGVHHIIVKKEGYVAANGEKEILIINHHKEPLMFILTPIASDL